MKTNQNYKSTQLIIGKYFNIKIVELFPPERSVLKRKILDLYFFRLIITAVFQHFCC